MAENKPGRLSKTKQNSRKISSADVVVNANASPFHGENRNSNPLGRAGEIDEAPRIFALARAFRGNHTENHVTEQWRIFTGHSP